MRLNRMPVLDAIDEGSFFGIPSSLRGGFGPGGDDAEGAEETKARDSLD